MNIIGHKKQLNFLENSLKNNSISQSYIFSGPGGVGKFLIANKFANSVSLGEESLDTPRKDNYENIVVVAPRSETKKGVTKIRDISIDDVRDAQKKLSTFPLNGKYNVLLINDSERLNKSSQNALLKILEEPNSTSIIILITSEENRILPTIKSRCQVLRFGLVPLAEMKQELSGMNSDVDLDNLILLSMGRPGMVFDMQSDSEELERRKNSYSDFRNIFSMELFDRLNKAEELAKDVGAAVSSLESWIWFLRIQGYKNIKSRDKLCSIYSAVEKIEKSLVKIKHTNSNPRLVMENLLINL
ncbi:ATP-binding protein [Patescibacteria group bacterium]